MGKRMRKWKLSYRYRSCKNKNNKNQVEISELKRIKPVAKISLKLTAS